jgi:serine/threonine protein kinase
MSSGSLPLATYHRAAQIGEGTYGSIFTVYNEDGEEFALKLFIEDDDDDNNNNDETEEACRPCDLGALREISCLRLFAGENKHENIVPMCDVQSEWTDEEEGGAGTAGCLGMALPLYRVGTLADAITAKSLQSRHAKVKIAHGLLSAVAFLHDNGIMHRDIKSDNIMLENDDNDDSRVSAYKPVLIDFSLAKIVDTVMCSGGQKVELSSNDDEPIRHTGAVGTVTYTAPEVVARQPYSLPMDLWSVGVVLLELLQDETLIATKNKEALTMIDQALAELADQPFPDLLRGLLQKDPAQRLTARGALEHSLFAKFGLKPPPVRILNLSLALPFDDAEEDTENPSPNLSKSMSKKGTKPKHDRVLEKRVQTVDRICRELDAQHPLTRHAALEYCQQMLQLDDTLDDLTQSQSLLDCVVLAHRFWETEVVNLHDLNAADKGPFASWSLEDYVDNEATLFMIMDYCLYPRRIL